MKFYKRVLLVLFIALIHYLITELLNDRIFFDFSNKGTIGKLILSLVVGIVSELVVTYKKS